MLLNLPGEVVQDCEGDILEQVISIYCQDVEPEPEEQSTPSILKDSDVLEMLRKLQQYEERQEESNNKILTEFGRYERQIRLRIASNKPVQTTIEQLWAKKV